MIKNIIINGKGVLFYPKIAPRQGVVRMIFMVRSLRYLLRLDQTPARTGHGNI